MCYCVDVCVCWVSGLPAESRVPTGDVGFDKFFSAKYWKGSCEDGHMGKLMSVDQPNYSDSNSEVSESESVATNRTSTNLSILGGSEENVRDKIDMPFFDFLGVGDS